ncbi:MAG: hypothetical protein WBQ50_16965 [Nocardioides sp.]
MKGAYRVLAGLIALSVVVQAAAIAFAYAGLGVWIADGGTLDAAAMEDESTTFTGVLGFPIHAINGMMVIPILALALLIVSFFAKVERGIVMAVVLIVLVVLQVALGILGHETPYAGLLHGINALIIFGGATQAARQARAASTADLPSASVNA